MGLSQDILTEPVSSLDLRQLLTVRPGDTVRHAIGLMREHRLGCAVVIDEQGRPLGKFTERRLIRLLLSQGASIDDKIEQHMSRWLVRVSINDPIMMVIDGLQAGDQRFVCVCDEQGKAIALTGQKGVMEYVADHFPRQIKVQRMRSKLHMDHREGA